MFPSNTDIDFIVQVQVEGLCVIILGNEQNACDCKPDEFRCATAQTDQACCIPEYWLCDSAVDCFDGSDEGDVCAASAIDGKQ